MMEIDGKDFTIYPSSFSIIAHPALRVTECWKLSTCLGLKGGAVDLQDNDGNDPSPGLTQRDKQPSAVTFPLSSLQFRVFSLKQREEPVSGEKWRNTLEEHDAECQIKTEI